MTTILSKYKEISIPAQIRGATDQDKVNKPILTISIHAPKRGATVFSKKYYPALPISIHAPIRGATHKHQSPRSNWINFNPHTYKRCDTDFIMDKRSCSISIPAPIRGATLGLNGVCDVIVISIHTPIRGATTTEF
ncbi:hypothetical protein BTGOE5_57500 [Bacillus thuringiensis]|nr:hypothetical protein IIS_04837 [Bacillus cereus VD131]OFC88639.1 hypothetical protein BTGOE5_57500 [Bacillus thuringiensis]